jgi:protein-disulfide isomerase
MSKKSKRRKKEREEQAKADATEVTETITKKDEAIKEVEIFEEKSFPKSEEQKEKEDVFLEGKSIDEIIEAEEISQRGKNYLAVVILLAGALLGSLFIDVAQLLSKKGYSVRALREADIFTLDEKTWVAYNEPIVNLTVLTVSEDNIAECPTCKPPEEVMDLFKKVMPTLAITEVDIDSEEGKLLTKENNIKVLPAVIFSEGLNKTEFYNGEAKVLFSEVNESDNYLLSLAGLGLPIGKYIELPEVDASNPVLGNKDAAVKIILFSDHQCPFCAKFFKDIVTTTKAFGDKVALVYKDLPLEFHPQAMNAAIAGECAKDQDKFWEMSARLYATQKQWGNLDDENAKAFFKKQSINLKLDIEKFGVCLDEEQHKGEIENSKKQAEEFGISGTPSMFIGDEFVGGVVPTEQLKAIIQAQIDALEKPEEESSKDVNNTDEVLEKDNTETEKAEEIK